MTAKCARLENTVLFLARITNIFVICASFFSSVVLKVILLIEGKSKIDLLEQQIGRLAPQN